MGMKIGVVGGVLQGSEIAYLGKKAGCEVIMIDRRPVVPAMGLCDRFFQLDVLDPAALDRAMADVDLVMPALESEPALDRLHEWAAVNGIPIVHDPHAYAVSSSKIASDAFFRKYGFPVPDLWPGCRFPVIAKPSRGSGSRGVGIFHHEKDLTEVVGSDPASGDWIVQAFIDGPTYSVEVVRRGGRAAALQVTDLHMDAGYDCKRVTAPSVLTPSEQQRLKELSVSIADALALDGFMDVEVVKGEKDFRILEIDARFPSQTPMAVYWSSGLNFVEMLAGGWAKNHPPDRMAGRKTPGGVILEHIAAGTGVLSVAGEHILSQAGPLHVIPDFFGADEAVTDYEPGKNRWVATLVCTAAHVPDAWTRRDEAIAAIRKAHGLTAYHDEKPVCGFDAKKEFNL